MISKVIRKGLSLPRFVPGYLNGARTLKAGEIPIVMYHGVVETPPSLFHWCHLGVGEFERQVRFLESEYRVCPLGEVVEALEQGRRVQPRTAVITFDDGYRSVLTTALPILERLQLPFTVFLVTQHVATQELVWPDRLYHAIENTRHAVLRFREHHFSLVNAEKKSLAHRTLGPILKSMSREEKDTALDGIANKLGVDPSIAKNHCLAMMDWDEVATLCRSPLATIGSHSHTHQILSQCSTDVQRKELRRSRDILVDRLGRADLFAYPNGTRDDFTETTKGLLKDLGYRCGLATTPGLNDADADLYAMQRVNVGADTSIGDFQLRMLGW